MGKKTKFGKDEPYEINFSNLIPTYPNDIEIFKISNEQYVIKKENTESMSKISCELYDLICLIDNKSSISEISAKYKDKFYIELNPEIIYDILKNRFKFYGFLEQENLNHTKRNNNYLSLRVNLISPEKIDFFLKFLYPLFKPKYFFILLIMFSFISSVFVISQFHNIINVIDGINLKEISLYLILFYLIVIMHEFGHAASCNFFKAQHKGIGFGFYLLMPVFFVDVTDIWRLNKKNKIIVDLGGVFMELLLSTIFVLIYFIIKEEILMLMPAIILSRLVINLNPIFRYDGYWVLVDLTGISNLRKRSLDELIYVIKNIKNSSISNYLIASYGFITIISFILFFAYILFINPLNIIEAPVYIFNFIKTLIVSHEINLDIYNMINKIAIPAVFYSILINYLIKSINKGKELYGKR